MRTLVIAGALVAAVGANAIAQAPAPRPDGRGAPGAEMLLARTGELGLTDAQVTRLAAIARRSEARRASMRASRDSIRSRFGPGNPPPDSAARRQLGQRLRADADRMREQERSDRRDAIAVLTADQQARAWEIVTARGRGHRMRGPAMRGEGMGGQGVGRGMRRPGMGTPMGPRRDSGARGEMRPRPGTPGAEGLPRRPVPPS